MTVSIDDLQALIEGARTRLQELPSETLNVVVGAEGGGEFVPVTIQKLPGAEWLTLEAMHPPRPGIEGDERLGANVFAIPSDYPVERIKVAGSQVSVELWRDLLAVLDAVHLENITGLMYGLNRTSSMMQVEALGKVSAGGRRRKRDSPASSASRSAASKGGNPQK